MTKLKLVTCGHQPMSRPSKTKTSQQSTHPPAFTVCFTLFVVCSTRKMENTASRLRGPGDSAWVLPCGHAYHKRCATEWLLHHKGKCPLLHHKGECPLCKSAVPTFPVDEASEEDVDGHEWALQELPQGGPRST